VVDAEWVEEDIVCSQLAMWVLKET
jgi:hypothetical protein